VLNRELVALYGAFTRGEASPLHELPIQYGDFAAWQQRRRAEGAVRADLDFWRRELTGLPTLALPTDRPRPAVQRFRGARLEFTLPQSLTRAIGDACRRADVTPYMFFLGAFTALLSRYTGQDDVAVGSPIANRTPVETEGLIGYFSNTIVLRTDLSGDPSFHELLARIRQRTLDAYGHQGLPFEELVNVLAPERDTSRNPLFQVMMVLQNAPLERVPFAGLETTLDEVFTGTSKFDLWLQLMAVDGTWTATFEYDTDLWDDATIARMSRHLTTVLAAVTADPLLPVSEVPLLDDDERRQVLVEFNDTAVDHGPPRLLHEYVEAQVRRTPDRVAVSFEDEQLTYCALDDRADRLARRLVEAGVGPDVLVGVHAERSAELVVALLAVLKSGGAYVPLEPSYPAERLEHMVRDAATPVLLTDRPLPPRLQGLTPHVIHLDAEPEASGPRVGPPSITPAADALAYVIYTSGSTGLPKGAMNSHRGIGNRLLWMQEAYGLTADDRVLQKTPFSFDVSVWEFFWPLMTGATLVVARPDGHKDPTYLIDTIRRERITTVHFVPSMLRVVLDHPELADCSSLVRVICSGEALPAEFRDRFFARLPGAELHNLYGPTEAAVDVTAWQCREEDTSPVVPIGKPIANTQIYILDGRGRPAPIGIPGELYIGGANVGRGYLRRPELDAERFLPDPFRTTAGATMYRTGDLARWRPSGDIEFLGRLDSQVKLRGMRIELGEVESVLRAHPRVADAAVIVRTDGGEERRQLVAYPVPARETRKGVTSRRQGLFDEYMKADAPLHDAPSEPLPAPPATVSAAELRDHLREKLPDFMIPHAFVVLDRLPVSTSGKLDRRALPPPPPPGSDTEVGEAPRTAEERALATIWAEVLGVERVDIDGNFFALGGDSIDSIQLVARAAAAGLRVTPADVVRYPSIRQLAARVAAAEPSGVATARSSSVHSAIGADIEDAYPLSTYQSEMLRRKCSDGPASLYVQSVVTRVRSLSGEPLDLDALDAAWQAVVARHPVFRSAFRWEAVDEPIQVVHRSCRITVERHEFGGMDGVHRWVESARRRGFALDRPGHLQVGLFPVGPDELVMAFLYNYMFSDGWSLSFVLADLLVLFDAGEGGRVEMSPVLPYRRYLDHQRSQDREALEAYWRRTMASFEVTPLVAALGGTSCSPSEGGTYRRKDAVVSAAATRALRTLARGANLTLNHVVLAAWALVLARWTGRSRASFGNMMTGRSADLAGYERMVGIFTSVLPIQLDIAPDETFLDWVEQARQLQLDLDAHHHASLGDIRHWAGRPEDADLFESCFVFLNFPFSSDGEDAMRRTEIKIIEGQTQTEHPLRVAVFAFGETLDLQFFFYERQLPEQAVEQLMNATCELLERLAGSATERVDQVLSSVRRDS
jgi:amino acid adenylation domain-containing protein